MEQAAERVKERGAAERRQHLLALLAEASPALTGGDLAQRLRVSRQVIVQDVAVLRAAGEEILATPQGYVLASRLRPAAGSISDRPPSLTICFTSRFARATFAGSTPCSGSRSAASSHASDTFGSFRMRHIAAGTRALLPQLCRTSALPILSRSARAKRESLHLLWRAN